MSDRLILTPEWERDWRRARYKRLSELGLCTCCGKEKNDGTRLCARCKETQRLGRQARQRERAANNLCRRCGAPLPDDRYTHCKLCRLDASERVKRYYHRKKGEEE